MKLKTRLVIAFVTAVLLPIVLSTTLITLVGSYQFSSIEKTYQVEGTSIEMLTNPMRVFGQVTVQPYREMCRISNGQKWRLEDVNFLQKFNQKLIDRKSYLILRREGKIVYAGVDLEEISGIVSQLPPYDETRTGSENSIYLGGKTQALVKQVDFLFEDGEQGSVFIVTDVSAVMPEIQEFGRDIIAIIFIVLFITATCLIYWIYRGVMIPLGKMQRVAQNITKGNLDFEIPQGDDDEFGQIFKDLESMRSRLRESAEEKLKFDRESKELISNISHDLKTPVTTIKGYAEGILDGVADTPEKTERYVRTIYNKANEMNTLINELTLYSKIDTNRIPYNFNTIPVNDYFDDCAEELSMELESKNVEFGYFNYVENNEKIIADAEQIKRVIHNIINNSLKYMDKTKPIINLRVKDVGDFIQIELEDNGKGIPAKDLSNIFERFYRTDASRNSSKGGSGIGLSIVKKIVEEHGGKIWATSRENTGTTMHFVLRKYQEVPTYE